MSNPVAAHTFDFKKVYLSTRTSGAPGSGVWTNPALLFDAINSSPTFVRVHSFSAGGLSGTDPYGILGFTDLGLAYLGNGLPTAPIVVSYSGQVSDLQEEGYWDTSIGAFAFGGAIYAPVQDNGVQGLTVIKSTDSGATWATVDNSNRPAAANATFGAIQRIDNLLYFFMATDNSDTVFQVYVFNMATNLWGTPFAPLTQNIQSFQDGVIGDWANAIMVYPNGDVGIIYTASGGGLPRYRLWVQATTTWQSEVILPGVANGIANMLIDSDLEHWHVLTFNSISAPIKGAVNYVLLAHDGTFTSIANAIPAISGPSSDGVGHCSIQNGMLFVPRDDNADFDNAVWVAALPVAAFSKELLPIPSGEANAINSITIVNHGSGYVANDTGTIDGGITGYIAQYKVNSVYANAILTFAPHTPGSGYAVNDTGTINGGSPLATYQILAVSGGVPTSVQITDLGGGYSIASNVATTHTSGSGTGLTIDINSLTSGVKAFNLPYQGGGYSVGVAATATGGAQPGVGTGLTFDIVSVQQKTPSCAYMMFPNGIAPTPPEADLGAMFGLTASASISALAAVCPLIGNATLGVFYSQAIPVSGGTEPYAFALTGGSFPPGLSLNTSTGVISGTPSTAGMYTYTVTVTDADAATVMVTCTITVNLPCPSTHLPGSG